jgi:acyl-CoA reductase-like NAD-dependent aldehyde dehydrogenase
MTIFRNFIGGAWIPALGGDTFEDRNPADTEDLIGAFPASGAEDVQRAVSGVVAAWPAWAARSPEQRAEVLERAAAIIALRAGALARALTREEGKTLDEATVEVRRTAANFRLYAGEASRISGETFAVSDGQLACTLREPVGVVAVITPWNFPATLPSRKIAPALAMGNGVVFKPSEVTPLMGQHLVEALLEAGLPPAVIALVHGHGSRVGRALVEAPQVNAISFTGSYVVGRAIQQAAGVERRCQLEMGGKNAAVVLADADIKDAVSIVMRGAFGLSGQACTATSRVLVAGPLYETMVARLIAAAERLTIGNGLVPGIKMGPLANAAQLEKVLGHVRRGVEAGARLRTGGTRLTAGEHGRGHFFSPTVFTDVPRDAALRREEVFGPVIFVEPIASLDEAIAIVNETEYGLSASIVTKDIKAALRFARGAQAGVIKVNSPTTGNAPNAPFGGFKHSSNQAAKEQAGAGVMDFYTQTKTVYLAG